MTELDPRHREQIEETLGRPLADEELVAVDRLDELTPAELEVARALAQQQLVLCSEYLRALTDASVGATKRFMDDLLID
jgi:hypothetical protein